MRSPDTSKPPFHARNKTERAEMKHYVLARLYENDWLVDDANRHWEPVPIDTYALAKAAARRGNLQPLAKILITVMNDPGITDFLAVPRRERGRRVNPFKQYGDEGVVETVRRIRQIRREDFGLVKRDRQYDLSAEAIAGEVYGLDERVVKQLMKKA